MAPSREPSSGSAGFFQERPHVENQFYEDMGLRRVLELYLPSPVQHSIAPDLSRFGSLVLSREVLDWVNDAEKNVPFLRTWDSFGKRKDELVTSEGWRRLQELGQAEGIIAIPYENKIGPYSRVHQFLKYHLWTASCAYVTCPSGMTDGAARLLTTQLSNLSLPSPLRPVLSSALSRLISRDPSQAWTSGQWMTERSGGSDVSGTETVATRSRPLLNSTGVDGAPLGEWSISGFKWFSSATDANMAILLAQTPDSDKVSAFYVPMRRTLPSASNSIAVTQKQTTSEGQVASSTPVRRISPSSLDSDISISSLLPYNPQRYNEPEALPSFYVSFPTSPIPASLHDNVSSLLPYNSQSQKKSSAANSGIETELNGLRIQRLKSKLGTRAVPTAELELSGMRGYLLGQEGRGISEIATILNITRVHNSITALGLWGRGLAVARSFARVRVVGGKKLSDIPAHVRTLAAMEVEYRALMHLTFFTVLLLGITEQDPNSKPYMAKVKGSRNPALDRIKPSPADAKILLRLLTPVIKALTAKAAIAGLSECMEALGGVGYLENEEMEFNIARLARDANVLSIWEGTTNIMAVDFLKVLKPKAKSTAGQSPDAMAVLEKWVQNVAADLAPPRWKAWKAKIENGTLDTLQIEGRAVMWELGRLVAGVLLVVDAEMDGDETARELAERWMAGVVGGPKMTLEQQVEWDKKIVFGTVGEAARKAKL